MICQSCGKCVTLKDTCIVEFKGKTIPINAKWIDCDDCAIKLTLSVYAQFGKEYCERFLKVYYAVTEQKYKKGAKK